MTEDNLTLMARKALNVLFVSNPKGTSLGVLLGVIIEGVLGLFSPVLKTIEMINIAAVKTWHLMAGGVVVMNLPSYLDRKKVDPSILNAIAFIEEQKNKADLPDWQVKQMYTNLFQKVLENVSLNAEGEKTAEDIRELITSPSSSNKSNKQINQDK